MAYPARSTDRQEKHANNIAFNGMDARPIIGHI